MQFVTSCISTTLVLVLLGTVIFLGLSARNLSVYVRENINFSLLLSDELKESELVKLQDRLDHARYIKATTYVSKEQALQEQTEAMGTDPKEFLGYNPFTASMEIRLHSAYTNPDSLAWITKELRAAEGVTEIVYPEELMEAVNTNLRRIGTVLLAIAALLTLVSFALINNTVRLTLYAQRFLIHTMKLVGAGWGFIRRPFLLRSLWVGLLSGILANAVLMGAAWMLLDYEPELVGVITTDVLLWMAVSVLLFGLLITYLCAYLSINKYLRMRAGTLYYL